VAGEGLLPKVFDMGEKVVGKTYKLFDGQYGYFCWETIFMENLEVMVFDISSSILAGRDPFISASLYSDLRVEKFSIRKRISLEIDLGIEKDKL